jgi:hypothetical protein
VSKPVNIELTGDQALVLFDWLTENEEKVRAGEAERRVLWAIEAALEQALVEPFAGDYRELVARARARIVQG